MTDGAVRLQIATDPPIDVRLVAGNEHAIPPAVAHRVDPEGPMEIVIEFFVRAGQTPRRR
jgi:hypothetical protein